eukprot:COSAG02_NODE_90_length_37755_cov_29.833364_32_plen_86_part_00
MSVCIATCCWMACSTIDHCVMQDTNLTGSLSLEEVVKDQSQSIAQRIARLDRMEANSESMESRRFNERKQTARSKSLLAPVITLP